MSGMAAVAVLAVAPGAAIAAATRPLRGSIPGTVGATIRSARIPHGRGQQGIAGMAGSAGMAAIAGITGIADDAVLAPRGSEHACAAGTACAAASSVPQHALPMDRTTPPRA
jgi:hypothetical protein